ncbi:MAG TPA: serine protease [Anaerolineales bacterium]|nr:serine protease [Anaerolineales bacterium]
MTVHARSDERANGEWLDQLSVDSAEMVSRAMKSVVVVHNGRRGAGAGVIWDDRGTVITNAHVVARGRLHVRTQEGTEGEARIAAINPDLDLAALRWSGEGVPLPRGDAHRLRAGEWVYALGNPWGVIGAATGGVVIGMGADLPEMPVRGREWLALGLHLRPGHSGGAVIDSAGRLVGINTMMTGPEVGVAIPIHIVEAFAREARI